MRFLAPLLLLVSTPALATPITVPEVLQNAVDVVIRPGFSSLETKAVALEAGMEKLCATPTAEGLKSARDGFAAVAIAHARIENFQFGPLTAENRTERLLLWPDPKGIALRQVQTLLAAQDESVTHPAALAGKSVAVQGLNALEYVLYGTGADELATAAGGFRCRYGHAVAGAIRGVAEELSAEWERPDGIADHLIHPGPENNDFRTEQESLEGLAGTMAHGVEAIRDMRLMPFLGTNGKPAPKQALYWRSGLTVPAIGATFDGLLAVLQGSKIAELAPPEQGWVDNSVEFEFANAARAVAVVKLPVAEALKDKEQAKALNYLLILTDSLRILVSETLPGALGLTVGFSALDKD